MYQKTIVRYELNDRKYKVDDSAKDFYDKWQFPCFLGLDNNNDFVWYECNFETIVNDGNVHKLFFFEDCQLQYQNDIYTVVDNLMNFGLITRNENGKTYKYIFEGYQFEKLIIKEILGIEEKSFQELKKEQFQLLEKKLDDIWKKQAILFQRNKDCFIDFSSILK